MTEHHGGYNWVENMYHTCTVEFQSNVLSRRLARLSFHHVYSNIIGPLHSLVEIISHNLQTAAAGGKRGQQDVEGSCYEGYRYGYQDEDKEPQY